MHERAHRTRHGSLLQVRVIQDNSRCFPAQFEKHGLDVFASGSSNKSTDRGATSEADFSDCGMSNKGSGDFCSVGGPVVEYVEATCG